VGKCNGYGNNRCITLPPAFWKREIDIVQQTLLSSRDISHQFVLHSQWPVETRALLQQVMSTTAVWLVLIQCKISLRNMPTVIETSRAVVYVEC
jgi:hypothetical protein